jgi:hypothetical protein
MRLTVGTVGLDIGIIKGHFLDQIIEELSKAEHDIVCYAWTDHVCVCVVLIIR